MILKALYCFMKFTAPVETPCYSKGSPSAEVALKFYAAMREGCETSTSLINSERFYDEIKPSLEAGRDVIISTISSGISGTYKQACDAAQRAMADFPARKVHVFDSYNASMGEGLFDIYAAKMGDEGKSFEEVCGWLESHRLNMHSVFTVSDLKYLKKGGRLTPAVAAIGTLLKIKPVLQIQGEKLDQFKKVRKLADAKQVMTEAVRHDLETRFKELREAGKMSISIAHTQNEAEAAIFRDELVSAFPDVPFTFCDPLSLSVSCHIGPGALAVAACVRY